MKNIWIWVAAAVVIVGGAALFFMNGGIGGFQTMGNTSLRSLLSSNTSQKCSFTNADSTGTIYVGMGQMRGDFSSKVGQASAQSHMIITNNIVYIWIDGTGVGYRMAFDDMKPGQSGSSQGVDADAKVATDCSSWQASEASFVLPTTVTFSALGGAGATQPAAPTSETQSTGASAGVQAGAAPQSYYQQQCAACNVITDKTAKAQCIASFDCPDK